MTDQGPGTVPQPPVAPQAQSKDQGRGEAALDMADLKRKSVRGGMVTMLSQGVSIAIQLASTVILARMLTPDDYGTIAMVMAVTAFAGLFRDLGLSSAAIQKKDLTDAQQSNLFWLNVAMGAALTAIVAAAAPLVAWFYGKPELTLVTVALSASFLIGSLGAQHATRLVRDMQFARRATATITGSLVSLAVAVSCALDGLAYWALVWGGIAGSATTTALLWLFSPFRLGWFRRGAGIREMVGFGVKITAFDFVNYFQRNLDNILIGRFWGAAEIGFYSKAYSILMLPITTIRNPINSVAYPALSKLQDQPEAFRNYYLKTTTLIALLSMPIAAFCFVASGPIIELVLGSQWSSVSPIFSLLALAAFIQPASGFAGSLMLALGQGSRYFKGGVFNALIISLAFIIGVNWGATGVALAYTIANYIVLYPWLSWSYRESPVRFRMFLRACLIPGIASVVGTAICFVVMRNTDFTSILFELIVCMLVFASTYGTCIFASRSCRGILISLMPRMNPGIT